MIKGIFIYVAQSLFDIVPATRRACRLAEKTATEKIIHDTNKNIFDFCNIETCKPTYTIYRLTAINFYQQGENTQVVHVISWARVDFEVFYDQG